MATFFKRSEVWVVDFRYEGRPRRWLKALPAGADAPAAMRAQLQDLYGAKATAVSVRRATPEEDQAYVRGDLPRNAYCPSGKEPLTAPMPPAGDGE